jgi:hypothetical protein
MKRALEREKLPLGIIYKNKRPVYHENTRIYEKDKRPLYKRELDKEALTELINSLR